jgi:hypothetical protein
MRSAIVSACHVRVGADALLQPLDLELHLLAQVLVERAQRLVHQEQRRIVDEGAGQRDALLLAAG